MEVEGDDSEGECVTKEVPLAENALAPLFVRFSDNAIAACHFGLRRTNGKG